MIFARRFVALFGRHRYGLTVRGAAAGCSVRPQGGGPGFGRMEEAARTAGVSCPSGKAGGESCVENESRRTFPLAVSAGSAVSTVGLGRTITVLKRDRALWVPLEIRGDESRGLHRFPRGVSGDRAFFRHTGIVAEKGLLTDGSVRKNKGRKGKRETMP